MALYCRIKETSKEINKLIFANLLMTDSSDVLETLKNIFLQIKLFENFKNYWKIIKFGQDIYRNKITSFFLKISS